MPADPINLEGLTPDEILALPAETIDGLILCGEPLVFRAGTAEILGKFSTTPDSLILELCHIDGGGEGVLPTISLLAERFARQRGLRALDWRVHALDCADPNPKLRRVLERRGFVIEDVPGSGPCFHQVRAVQ